MEFVALLVIGGLIFWAANELEKWKRKRFRPPVQSIQHTTQKTEYHFHNSQVSLQVNNAQNHSDQTPFPIHHQAPAFPVQHHAPPVLDVTPQAEVIDHTAMKEAARLYLERQKPIALPAKAKSIPKIRYHDEEAHYD